MGQCNWLVSSFANILLLNLIRLLCAVSRTAVSLSNQKTILLRISKVNWQTLRSDILFNWQSVNETKQHS